MCRSMFTNRTPPKKWWRSIISNKPIVWADKAVVAQNRLKWIWYPITQLVIKRGWFRLHLTSPQQCVYHPLTCHSLQYERTYEQEGCLRTEVLNYWLKPLLPIAWCNRYYIVSTWRTRIKVKRRQWNLQKKPSGEACFGEWRWTGRNMRGEGAGFLCFILEDYKPVHKHNQCSYCNIWARHIFPKKLLQGILLPKYIFFIIICFILEKQKKVLMRSLEEWGSMLGGRMRGGGLLGGRWREEGESVFCIS